MWYNLFESWVYFFYFFALLDGPRETCMSFELKIKIKLKLYVATVQFHFMMMTQTLNDNFVNDYNDDDDVDDNDDDNELCAVNFFII